MGGSRTGFRENGASGKLVFWCPPTASHCCFRQRQAGRSAGHSRAGRESCMVRQAGTAAAVQEQGMQTGAGVIPLTRAWPSFS